MADETTEPVRPANSASKPEWVAYAQARGVETSGTRDEIRARVDEAEAAAEPERQADTANADPDAAAAPADAATAPDSPEQDEAEADASVPDHEEPSYGPPPVGTVTGFRLLPSEDEPVRAGGHVLTDQGWIAEATLAPAEVDEADEDGDRT